MRIFGIIQSRRPASNRRGPAARLRSKRIARAEKSPTQSQPYRERVLNLFHHCDKKEVRSYPFFVADEKSVDHFSALLPRRIRSFERLRPQVRPASSTFRQ